MKMDNVIESHTYTLRLYILSRNFQNYNLSLSLSLSHTHTTHNTMEMNEGFKTQKSQKLKNSNHQILYTHRQSEVSYHNAERHESN